MRPPGLEMLHAATSIGRMLEQDLGSGKRLIEVVDARRCASVYFSIKRAANFICVQDWWTHMTMNDSARRKAIASLTMHISWELWIERNARVFQHKSTLPSIILGRLKYEAQTWVKAGAKHLEFILPGD